MGHLNRLKSSRFETLNREDQKSLFSLLLKVFIFDFIFHKKLVFELMFPVYVIKNIKAIFLTFNWTNIEQLLPQGQ